MILNDFISIISSLNGGAVISNESNDDNEILLGEQSLKLYYSNNKYYFLSEYQENYDDIEMRIKKNRFVKENKDLRPNNSYLILFYEINDFDLEVSKRIIMLEENEYFYKKYVFYYTKEEYKSFEKWFSDRSEERKSLSNILKTEQCSPESDDLYMQFLLRLIIKIPFLKLDFKKMELESFDNLLIQQLNGLRQNKVAVHEMFNRLSNDLNNQSVDEIAESLFTEIMGGLEDENQVN